jgi:hypothetical protein
LEYGLRGAYPVHWTSLVRPAGGNFTLVGRRERATGALLAALVQLALIVMWVKQTHVDSPWARSGIPDAVVDIQYFPPSAASGVRRSGPRPAKAPLSVPTVTPPLNTITLSLPREPPVEPPKPVEEPQIAKQREMSEHDAAEFRRQWAQLQDDMQKKALDDATHHNLKTETRERARQLDSEMAKVRESDKPIQTVLREHGQQSEHDSRQDAIDGSIFAGELCVTGSRGEADVQIALPCMGENFVTDFSWYARLRAPKRGEPSYHPVDPNSRVYVREFKFSPATLAAFEDASVQLRKIQVTMRMVYLPDLRYPLQLLSRDNNAGAIGAEAFGSEAELAAYLQNWADNVRRWTAPRTPVPDGTPATAPKPDSP